MAVTSRSGADGSGVVLIPQTAYGSPITPADQAAQVAYNRKFLPISNLDGGFDPDIEESDLISSIGADTPDDLGQIGADLSFRTRVLVDTFGSVLRGLLTNYGTGNNPSVALTAKAAQAAAGAWASNKANPASNTKWTGGYQAIANQLAAGDIPCKVKITGLAGLSVGDKIRIKGYRGIGRTGRDQLYFTEDVEVATGATETDISTKYWREIIEIENLSSSTPTGTPNVAWQSPGYFIEFTIGSQFDGWTVLGNNGGVPFVAYDYVPSQLEFSANSTRIELNVSGSVSRIYERRNLIGGANTEVFALSDDDKTAFPDADTRYYPGWGGTILFGGKIVKYTDLTAAINFNYEPETGVDGSRFKTGVEATRNRQVTFTPTVRFVSGDNANDVFEKWDEIFLLDDRTPIELRMYAFSSDGQQSRITFLSPSSQMNQAPRISVDSSGPINRSLSFKALASGSQNEIKVQMISPTEWVPDSD